MLVYSKGTRSRVGTSVCGTVELSHKFHAINNCRLPPTEIDGMGISLFRTNTGIGIVCNLDKIRTRFNRRFGQNTCTIRLRSQGGQKPLHIVHRLEKIFTANTAEAIIEYAVSNIRVLNEFTLIALFLHALLESPDLGGSDHIVVTAADHQGRRKSGSHMVGRRKCHWIQLKGAASVLSVFPAIDQIDGWIDQNQPLGINGDGLVIFRIVVALQRQHGESQMSAGGGTGDDDLIRIDIKPLGVLFDPTISGQAVCQTLFRGDSLFFVISAKFNSHTHIALPGQMGAVRGIHQRVTTPAPPMDAKDGWAEFTGFEIFWAKNPEDIVGMIVAVTKLLSRCQHVSQNRLTLEPVFRRLTQVECLVNPPKPIRARTKLEQDVPILHAQKLHAIGLQGRLTALRDAVGMLTGDVYRRLRVGGDLHIQAHKAIGKFPAGFDGAMNRIVAGLCPVEPFFENRLDGDPLISGRLRANASNVTENEGSRRPVRIMGKRVHARVGVRTIRQPAAKVFPYRITVLGHIQPGRKSLVKQQLISLSVKAGEGKSLQDTRASHEAGCNMPNLLNPFRKTPGHQLFFILRNQSHGKSQGVARLRIGVHASVLIDQFFGKCFSGPFVKGAIFGSVFTFPDRLSHLSHDIRVVREVCGSGGNNRNLVTAGRLRVIRQPDSPLLIGTLILPSTGTVRVDGADEMIHCFRHGIIMALDDTGIAIFPEHAIHTKYSGIGPADIRSRAGAVVWGMIRKPSARLLRILYIGKPLVEESGEIEIINSGGHEKVHIPGIAATLVPLIAVGWNPQHVGPHRPLDIADKSTQQRIRTTEFGFFTEIGVKDNASHFFRCRLAGQTMNFNKLITMISKVWLKNLLTFSLAEIAVNLTVTLTEMTRAQVVHVNRSIRIQHLAMLKRNSCPGRSLYPQPCPAAEELSHIHDIHSRTRLGDRNRLDLPCFADGLATLPDELSDLKVELFRFCFLLANHYRLPSLVVIAGFVPAVHLPPRIIDLAFIDARETSRPIGRTAPGFVSDNGFSATVGIFNFKLRDQTGIMPVCGVQFCTPLHPSAAIPSVAEQHAHGVVAGIDHACDIKGLILDPFVVVGPFRRKHLVTNPLPIQTNFIKTQRGDIQHGTRYCFCGLEFLAQLARDRPATALLLTFRRIHIHAAFWQINISERLRLRGLFDIRLAVELVFHRDLFITARIFDPQCFRGHGCP